MTTALGEKISVCLLTYNHVNVIESTLRSILDQTLDGFEVVVSDDCSDDGTWDVIVRMAESDSRILPLRTPSNLGMAGNANYAVGSCDRPYVALLHHDDVYEPDLLESWGGVLERCPDAGFVFNPYAGYEDGVVSSDEMPGECFDGRWLLEHFLLARWGCVVRGTAMIRRDAWERVGGMREQFGLLADVDLWMRLARSARVGYVSRPVIRVRQERPSYYPDIYTGTAWSWKRQRLLYEIHATNRLEYLDLRTLGGRVEWQRFRYRMAFDVVKWLTYAVVRGRPDMITSSDASATAYDPIPLRVARRLFQRIGERRRPPGRPT